MTMISMPFALFPSSKESILWFLILVTFLISFLENIEIVSKHNGVNKSEMKEREWCNDWTAPSRAFSQFLKCRRTREGKCSTQWRRRQGQWDFLLLYAVTHSLVNRLLHFTRLLTPSMWKVRICLMRTWQNANERETRRRMRYEKFQQLVKLAILMMSMTRIIVKCDVKLHATTTT